MRNRLFRFAITAAVVALSAFLLFANRSGNAPRRLAVDRSKSVADAGRVHTANVLPVTPSKGAPLFSATAAMPRQYPIGLDVSRNHLRITALWLPAGPAGDAPRGVGPDILLMAKIQATEGNPNGFAKGDWVPYLAVGFSLEPAAGGAPITGTLRPLISADGLRYGSPIGLPGPGDFRLTLKLSPPAESLLGRVFDPSGTLAPWWEPFEVKFEGAIRPDQRRELSDSPMP